MTTPIQDPARTSFTWEIQEFQYKEILISFLPFLPKSIYIFTTHFYLQTSSFLTIYIIYVDTYNSQAAYWSGQDCESITTVLVTPLQCLTP